jgi:hypothetical protein
MKKLFALASLAALALIAAAPAPSSSPAPAAGASPQPSSLSVVCEFTPFYVFQRGSNIPMRARTPLAQVGQRFALVSGPRTTLESTQFYETDVVVVEPGYPAGAHYWLNRDCAIPVR